MNSQSFVSQSRRSSMELLPNEREISYHRIHHFFDQNKRWIGVLCAVVILAIVGGMIWGLQKDQLHDRANSRLASAHTTKALQEVIREFGGTEAALFAELTLADIYFRKSQWDQATTCYQNVIKRYPSSPLAPSATIGLAAVAEAKGKVKEA